MSVIEDTALDASGDPAPAPAPVPSRRPERRRIRISVGLLMRVVVFAALAAFLLYYVGLRDMAQTTLTVVAAVVGTAAVWVAANVLFDQAYTHWTRFNAIVGFLCGFVGFFVVEANGQLRELFDRRVRINGQGVFNDVTGWRSEPFDINGLLWGLIGGAVLGAVLALLTARRLQPLRLPIAIVGFAIFGLVAALAFDTSARPLVDWVTVWACTGIGAVLFGLVALWRRGARLAVLSVLTGAAIGWTIGVWGGADIGRGNFLGVLYATLVPAVVVGARIGLATNPEPTARRRVEQRARAWIFVLPAMAFIAVGLLAPLIRTVYLSLHNRNGREWVGADNYEAIFKSKNSVNFDKWQNIFTSRLFFIALALMALGVVIGVVGGRRTRQPFERGPSSLGPFTVGVFVLSCAVLASIRGTIFNNLWWVIVVTTLATALGLAVAVLADRAKAENAAKSLVFLPMAISFIGAGIIWRFMYQARDVSQDQTGVMNAVWVWVGETTNSSLGKVIWLVVLGALIVAFAALVRLGARTGSNTMMGFAAGFALFAAYLAYRIIGPGLGGFIERDGTIAPKPVLFLQESPFNNMWLMVVLIWVQTGFAMVILSAAIKAVPTDLTEAAKVDGATESQIFWQITLPQIAPTIGVVTTSLFVTVMKVFDIVYAMTNGNFGTQVIANQMWITAFGQNNLGLGSALAIVLFVAVTPIMWLNIRRMQRSV